MAKHIREYVFSTPNEKTGYRIFPSELEDNDHVFFHGTAFKNFKSICENGFKNGPSVASVTFPRNSNPCIEYACPEDSNGRQNGCVLAVSFENLNQKGIDHEPFGIHVNCSKIQPNIVGYCVIPADYIFR